MARVVVGRGKRHNLKMGNPLPVSPHICLPETDRGTSEADSGETCPQGTLGT